MRMQYKPLFRIPLLSLALLIAAATLPTHAQANWKSNWHYFYNTVLAPAVLTAAISGAAVAAYQGIRYFFTYTDQQAFEYCYRHYQKVQHKYSSYNGTLKELSELIDHYKHKGHTYHLLKLYEECTADARTLVSNYEWLNKRLVDIELHLKHLPKEEPERTELKLLCTEMRKLLTKQRWLARTLKKYAKIIKKLPAYEMQRLQEENERLRAENHSKEWQNASLARENADLYWQNTQLQAQLLKKEVEPEAHVTIEVNI